MLEAVKSKGIILKYASRELRNDKDVALAAITQSKKAFEFVGDMIKDDEDIQNIIKPKEE